MKTENSMNPNPVKPTGMPLMAKIIMIIAVLAIGGYYLYDKVIEKKMNKEIKQLTNAQPQKVFDHKGNVIFAKCKDFKDISFYLENDITIEDYNSTLIAVASIPSSVLVIPNQELTYKSTSGKMMVYKCQAVKGVLMGKLKKI